MARTEITRNFRIVALGMKDALGLGKRNDGSKKPDMEEILNRLFVQGYRLAQEIKFTADSMIAVLQLEFPTVEEKVPASDVSDIVAQGIDKGSNGHFVPPKVVVSDAPSTDLGAGEVVQK